MIRIFYLSLAIMALELSIRFLEPTEVLIPSPHAQGPSHLEGAAPLPQADQNIYVSHNQGYGWGFAPGSIVEQGNIRSTIRLTKQNSMFFA